MALLVIGPSGVGKSSALDFAAQSLKECRFVCLDALARDLGRERGLIGGGEGVNALRQKLRDDDEFLRLGTCSVERLDPQDRGLLVVDVGAGFLDAPSASGFVSRPRWPYSPRVRWHTVGSSKAGLTCDR
jgi:hypothetical protein